MALYARQSVDKKDSISIESQLERCRLETQGQPFVTYADRGFSGKNTDRPQLGALLQAVKSGEISHVVVYKLDRISRSILDFAGMMELFARERVTFLSCTEKFDTATPMGRAMLSVCIVFAQLERETIQERVADAYVARSRRGFFMGGKAPYGFCLERATLDGVETAMLREVPEEGAQVREIYQAYAQPGSTLQSVAAQLLADGTPHLRGGSWNAARIGELLRNPVYVRADKAVLDALRSQGAAFAGDEAAFDGIHACYLYRRSPKGDDARALAGKELVPAPHEGIVSAQVWLACHRKGRSNRRGLAGKSPRSWLSGLVRCACCGHALRLTTSKSRQGRYFACAKPGCPGTGGVVYAGVLEAYVLSAMQERLGRRCALGTLSSAAKQRVARLVMGALCIGEGCIRIAWRIEKNHGQLYEKRGMHS